MKLTLKKQIITATKAVSVQNTLRILLLFDSATFGLGWNAGLVPTEYLDGKPGSKDEWHEALFGPAWQSQDDCPAMLQLFAGRSKRPASAYVLDARLVDTGASNASSEAWRLYLEAVYGVQVPAARSSLLAHGGARPSVTCPWRGPKFGPRNRESRARPRAWPRDPPRASQPDPAAPPPLRPADVDVFYAAAAVRVLLPSCASLIGHPCAACADTAWTIATGQILANPAPTDPERRRAPRPDGSWAEVTRVMGHCFPPSWGRHADGAPYNEGRSRGWPGDFGPAYEAAGWPAAAAADSEWGYGCWFFLARGSGVFVNVGRSLVAQTRNAVARALGAGCRDGGECNLPWMPPLDKLWCTLATQRGYDSIQVVCVCV